MFCVSYLFFEADLSVCLLLSLDIQGLACPMLSLINKISIFRNRLYED